MSILKKLFGPGKSDRVHPARRPRVRITALHRILFQWAKSGSEQPTALGNISTQGMGLLRADAPDAARGEWVEGRLIVSNDEFRVSGEVRHLSDSIVGCRFNGSFDELSLAIERYFRIEICALRLKQVDEAYLKKDPAGRVSWFTDGRQNEVYFVTDDSGIRSFHVSFLGNYIEGGRGKLLRCGHIIEDAPDQATKHKGSALLDLSPETSDEVLKMSHLLIANLEKIPADQAKLLKEFLIAKPRGQADQSG